MQLRSALKQTSRYPTLSPINPDQVAAPAPTPTIDPISIPTIDPISIPNMTDLTSYSTTISKVVVKALPALSTPIAYLTTWVPAHKALLNMLSPGDNRYLHLFYPPHGWTAGMMNVNANLCHPPNPGAYPIFDATIADPHLMFRMLEEQHRRKCALYQDSLIVSYHIKEAMVHSIPEYLRTNLFPDDLDFATTSSERDIFLAIKAHFSTPTDTDRQEKENELLQLFTYEDATSLDKYTSQFQGAISALALMKAPVNSARQVETLIANLKASTDADIFEMTLQIYKATHSTITSMTLSSLLAALEHCSSLLVAKHRNPPPTAPFSYAANGATRTNSRNRQNVPAAAGAVRAPTQPKLPWTYCFTHGPARHNSAECTAVNKAPGHHKDCTWANRATYPGHHDGKNRDGKQARHCPP